MAEKNTVTISFEKSIWDAACVLWGIFLHQNTEVLSLASFSLSISRQFLTESISNYYLMDAA